MEDEESAFAEDAEVESSFDDPEEKAETDSIKEEL